MNAVETKRLRKWHERGRQKCVMNGKSTHFTTQFPKTEQIQICNCSNNHHPQLWLTDNST